VSRKPPTNPKERRFPSDRVNRRVMLSCSAASLASVAVFKHAHGLGKVDGAEGPSRVYEFTSDPDHRSLIHYPGVHGGKGAIDVKFFFREEEAPKPALLLIYNIPPGASEGVHTHNRGDIKMGSFDEFYYILSGRGDMQIDGTTVPVAPGDHIFTPNGVAHGIENTSAKDDLRVYLVAMTRD
jgi:mannose-6-phosphate isomerase-like protein (cupin superfamily)